MPASRTKPAHPHNRPTVRRPSGGTNKPPRISNDIIIISSDDEELPKAIPLKAKFPLTARRPHPVTPSQDVVELHSDDSVPPNNHPDPADDMQRRLQQLQQENDRLKCSRASMEKELRELKLAAEARSQTKSLEPSQLEDCVSCEICTMKMWSPYILPDCGHTFCEGCLKDWFATILAQHMTTHPQYNPNAPMQIPLFFYEGLRHLHMTREQMNDLAAAFPQPIPQPSYTCPTCRAAVKNPPVESFAIKALVRIVAEAEGERSPSKARGSTRRVTATRQSGRWDGFFK